MEASSHLVHALIESGDLPGARVAAARFDSLLRNDPAPLRFPRLTAALFQLVLNTTTPAQVDSLARQSDRDSLPRFGPYGIIAYGAGVLAERPQVMAMHDALQRRFPVRQLTAEDPREMVIRGNMAWTRAIDDMINALPPEMRQDIAARVPRTLAALELQGLSVPPGVTTRLAQAVLTTPKLGAAGVANARWVIGADALVRGDSVALKAQLTALGRSTDTWSTFAIRSLRGIGLGRGGQTAAAAESLLVLEREHGDSFDKLWAAFGIDRLLAAQWLTDNRRYAPADSLLRLTEGYIVGDVFETAAPVFAATFLQRSRIAEGLGDKAAAVRFAKTFVALYDQAPPEAKPQLDEARARIARLTDAPDAPKSNKVP